MKDYIIELLKDVPIEQTEKIGINPILKNDYYIGTEEGDKFYIPFDGGNIYLEKDMYEIEKEWEGDWGWFYE